MHKHLLTLNSKWGIGYQMLLLCYVIFWAWVKMSMCELAKALFVTLAAVLFSFSPLYWPFPLVSERVSLTKSHHVKRVPKESKSTSLQHTALHYTCFCTRASKSALLVRTARAPQNNLYLNCAVTHQATWWLETNKCWVELITVLWTNRNSTPI